MRLLFLNRSFWPDLEASGQNLTELCEDLAEEHEITFISGPSYHVETARRGPWTIDQLGRIRIIRTWGTRFPKRRLPARLLNLGSCFALAAIAALTDSRPDVVIAATDPPLLGALGAIIRRRWRCSFVYNVRDLYPDVAEANGGVKSRFLLGLLKRANDFAYSRADLVIVLGHDMRRRLLDKGVPADKVVVVENNVDCRKIRPIEPNHFREQFGDKFIVMYSGNLGLSQQLETVLDAAGCFRRDQRILFLLVGEGARKQWLEDRARTLGLSNVRFLPYQPRERLAESLSAADLHLIPLLSAATGTIVPSKIYGILAAGRPFVAMMDKDSDAARLAENYMVGLTSAPGDSLALAQAIGFAISHPAELKEMGRRARRVAEQYYDRPVIAGQYAAMLHRAVSAARIESRSC